MCCDIVMLKHSCEVESWFSAFYFWVAVYYGHTLKHQCRHFDDIFITGCTEGGSYPTALKGSGLLSSSDNPHCALMPLWIFILSDYPQTWQGDCLTQDLGPLRLLRFCLIKYVHNWPFHEPIKFRKLIITASALTSVIFADHFRTRQKTFISLIYRTRLIMGVLPITCA